MSADGPAPLITVEEYGVTVGRGPSRDTRCRVSSAKPTRILAVNVQKWGRRQAEPKTARQPAALRAIMRAWPFRSAFPIVRRTTGMRSFHFWLFARFPEWNP